MNARYWWIGLAIGSGAAIAACANGTAGAPGAGDEDSGGGGNGDDASAGGDGGNPYGSDGGSSDAGDTDGGLDAGPSCIDDDAGCSTGSPGLCNGGNHHCAADGGSVCVPLYTEQPCYSGGATTRKKGICHDGTQTCTGALGSCEGEGLPNGVSDGGIGTPVEDCFNNLDDDCDGLVNNGCPVSLSLGGTTTLAGAGGSGGGAHTVMCPAGAFVTRVDSWFDDHDAKASGVSIYCATPSLIQGASSYSVTLAANAPAPYGVEHGSTNPNVERTDDCGLSGLTAITYMLGYADSYVEAQGHHCSSSNVTLAAANTITFNFVADTYSNGTFNEYSDPPPGTFFDRDCNLGQSTRNQVVVGYSVHDGSYLDNLTPICAPLLVNYSAGTPDP